MNSKLTETRITIAYEASSTVGPRSGIGRYTAELMNAMAAEAPAAWRFHALVNSPRHPPPDDPWTRAENVRVTLQRVPGKALLTGWRLAREPRIERLLGPADLLHSPASYDVPCGAKTPFVITVHDLFFLDPRAPEEPWGGGYFKRTFRRALPRADRVIVPSRATGDEAMRVYGLKSELITVIPEGVDHARFNADTAPDEAARVVRLVGGEGEYLIAIGAPTPRKNYVMLVEAFAAAFPDPARRPRLVFVGGRGFPKGEAALAYAIDRLGLGPWVRRTGYVGAEELPMLYRRAMALVYPSLYEGFGLPILEAMACGTPALTTDVGAAPEVAGGAALLTRPNVRDIAEGIAKLAGDAGLRARLKEMGLARAREFSWKTAARATLEVYAEAIERKRGRG